MPRGDNTKGPYKRSQTLEERFWSKVDKEAASPCWLWTGHIARNGYGRFSITEGSTKPHDAHRVSYELAHGPIPKGLWVCHHCDVRHCVCPDHLFLGTRADDMADMATKGRAPRGDRQWQNKLAEDDVRTIRVLLEEGDLSQREIAAQFGVSQGIISNIATRKKWGWLT